MAIQVKYSSNLPALADELIRSISGCWKDPFNSPTVIFPDSMMEQWFKLNWLRNRKGEQVLMNLKTARLDSFLFCFLDSEKEARSLSLERLHLRLIRELSEYKYSDALDPDLKYIFDFKKGKSEINYLRLYDFSKTLANLFMEYEISRPEWFPSNWNGWQKDLYVKVCRTGEYKTIAQLYFDKRERMPELSDSNKNIFLFGFSGMGQLYMEILERISEQDGVNLELFLQVDDGALSSWLGEYGNRFFEEWKKTSESPEFVQCPSKYPEFMLNSAPSRIREIEALHSTICKIIREKHDEITLDEIKVFAPDIKPYIPAIRLVFDEPMAGGKDGGLPYTIGGYSSSSSNVSGVIRILVGIARKRYFSRADFQSLIRNKTIRASYGISDEFIDIWTGWIDSMNVFRRRNTDRERDDWKEAKRRLLLSELTYDPIVLHGEASDSTIKPFENNADNDCVFGFISLIDDLYHWIALTKEAGFDSNHMEEIKECFRDILSTGKSDDEDQTGDGAVYLSLIGMINLIEEVFGDVPVDRDCFLSCISDSTSNVSLSQSGVVRGIEFISFKPNRVIPAKYVFFIGLDSESFPGTDMKNVLDVRQEEQPGDGSVPLKNKNTFLNQVLATSEKFYLSYVNKDLQKDEDFYPSSVVNEIKKHCKITETRTGIDEEKDNIDDLFTVRRLRNHRNLFVSKVTGKEENPNADSDDDSRTASKQRKAISLYKLRKYLEEPFRYQAENAFAMEEDDSDDNLEFEPICFDNLTISKLRNQFICVDDLEDVRKKLSSLENLPDGEFGKKQSDLLIDSIEKLKGSIQSSSMIEKVAGSLRFSIMPFQKIPYQTSEGVSCEIDIYKSEAYFNRDFESGTVKVIASTTGNPKDPEKKVDCFTVPAAVALALIAKTAKSEGFPSGFTFNVELYVLSDGRLFRMELSSVSGCEVARLMDRMVHAKKGRTLNSNTAIKDLMKKKKREEAFKLLDDLFCSPPEEVDFSLESDDLDYDDSEVRIFDGYELSGKLAIHNRNYKETHNLILYDFKDGKLKDFLSAYLSSLVLLSEVDGEDDVWWVSLYLINPKDVSEKEKHYSMTSGEAREILRMICDKATGTEQARCFPIEAFEKKDLYAPEYIDLVEYVSGEYGPWSYFKKSGLIDMTGGLGYDLDCFREQWEEQRKEVRYLIAPLF